MTTSSTLDRSRSTSPAPAQPAPQRRRWLRVLIALGVVLLLAAGGWVVAFSSVLDTRDVTVVGVSTLSARQVRDAAEVPLGKPLIRQDLPGIESRVASLKPVRTVSAQRHWPHRLTVTVQERTPVLAFRQPDGFLLVDSEGVGYLTVPSLPKSVVLASANLTDTPLLNELAVVAAALTPELRDKVDSVKAHTADGITLSLKDGDTVFWGSSDESVLKSEVTVALLKRPARTYDVSAPRNPSLR